jgi:iron complex outermembrane receptor protein
VEERQFGQVLASAGLRAESVNRRPDSGSGLPGRDFSLLSWSTGACGASSPAMAWA